MTTFKLLPVLVLVLCSAPVFAAESKKVSPEEQEAREAAEEDEAELKLGEMQRKGVTVSGKFSLEPQDPAVPASPVVGMFSAQSGQQFLVKVIHPNLLKQLSAHNNKTVTVMGKLRNKGKYLIVQNVIEAEPVPVARVRRGGL